MAERSIMEAMYIVKKLMEKLRDTLMVFFDLEKACDRICKGVIWKVREEKHVYKWYMDATKYME